MLSVVSLREKNPFLLTLASLFNIHRWDNDQYLKAQSRELTSDKKRKGSSLIAKDSIKRI